MHPPALRRLATVVGFLLVAVGIPFGPAASAAAGLDIGVVSSDSTRAFSTGQPAHGYSQGFDVTGRETAISQWVTDNGHNLTTLSDADLESPSKLAALDVVVLPYTVAINPAASLALRNWVKQGGALIPILSSPRVFLDGSTWKLWVKVLNYEAWEWGPLSEAYQMMFVNDPNPGAWQAKLRPGHPIVSNALASLGLGQAGFTRPGGSGVEFAYRYNSNVTSILDYAGISGSFSGFNGYSAAQATHYGSGRIVYFDIPIIDFLPGYNGQLAAISVGGGHNQGQLADALLDAAVDWAANGGGYGTVSPSAVTWGEVDARGTAIYIRQWVRANGTVPVTGTLTARVYNPSGVLVSEHRRNTLGIEPGRTHMYSWSYIKGSNLDPGVYRVVLEYRYTYPNYSIVNIAEAKVTRGQLDVPTSPISTEEALSPLVGDFNGSGGDDIATFSTTDGTWEVLESTGSAFDGSQWADFSTASGWQARMVGDFDDDGRDDIAQFHPSNGTWWVSRSNGSAFTTSLWADFSTASGWTTRLVGDFNGDDRADIANYYPGNGTWWVSQSNGSSFTTRLWADFSTASGWQAPMVGDFNGDGRDDIAQFHPSNGTWWISRSTGSGFVTQLWADFTTASGWDARLVGDFNGDGRDDIAQFHPSNGTWWISRSTGSGFGTSLWADFSTASGWQSRMVGDFNGDNRDDIAQFHPSNGTWWISRSTGSAFSTTNWSN